MKTLYISDLDGTLLNEKAEISDLSAGLLNEVISAGGYFSAATARTAATALIITKNVNINVPVILMNGVCIYDISKNEYVKTESIRKDSLLKMLDILEKFELSGFLFSITGSVLDTYYENVNSPNAAKFVEERTKKFGKVFTHTDSFKDIVSKNIIYYSVTDTFDLLSPVYEKLKDIDGLHIDFYRDVYDVNYWYLEISSSAASKYNAVKYLRENYNFEKIVCFGDNLNDLPMFNASDEKYAVANAKEEVKNAADGVVPSNLENGPAKKIFELFRAEQ